MKKYLVIVNEAKRIDSLDNQLFRTFDTEEAAIKWVSNNPNIIDADICEVLL